MSKVPMTVVGKAKMEDELKRLKSIERPAVIQAISLARAHGDLSENAEYDAAKEKQAFVEGRIQDLEDKLARAQVVDTTDLKTDKIVFGATIELMNLETEQKQTYRIVGSDESDVKAGMVSIESPIARQLLNKMAGDSVVIKVPKKHKLQDAGLRERFRRESRLLVQLQHPHIVSILDVGLHSNVPFVVMQYLSGGCLQDRMQARNGQPTARKSLPRTLDHHSGYILQRG